MHHCLLVFLFLADQIFYRSYVNRQHFRLRSFASLCSAVAKGLFRRLFRHVSILQFHNPMPILFSFIRRSKDHYGYSSLCGNTTIKFTTKVPCALRLFIFQPIIIHKRSLVRPLLEYASSLWSPYLVKDKRAIESTQRRASRIALGQKRREMSYEERCELLGWSTLERRREYFSLVECYKTVFELNGLECRDYFELCNNNTRSNNSFKIRMKK